MAERPRPRPRPRPTQKSSTTTASSITKAASLDAGSSSSVARSNSTTTIPLSSPNRAAKRVIVVEDTDEMFMRNRNRSSKTWQKLEQLDRKVEITEVTGSDEDEDENLTPRRRKRAKADSSVVPVWQKSQELARMLSQELSDSSDDDDSNDIVETTPTRQRNGKRKRLRSRSLSITPPPALPAHHIQNAKRIVRQTLEAALPDRPPSPTFIDLDQEDSSDSSLQPEFMALVQRVREESRSGSMQSIPDGIPGEELLLTVNWLPHPLATNATQEEWQYKVDKTDTFRDLFEAVAEDAGVPQANVILTYQGKRFYPSVTPHILKIWSDTAVFYAYEKTAYTYIQTLQPKTVFLSPRSKAGSGGAPNEPIDIDSDSEDDVQYIPTGSSFRASTPPRSQTQTQSLDSDSDTSTKNLGRTLKLVLRSALTGSKEITLTVRTTTRCDAVVKAFIKKAGLGEDKYPELFGEGTVNKKGRKSVGGSGKNPQLSLDGDKFNNDTQIGQTDLEDGDMVEVLGL